MTKEVQHRPYTIDVYNPQDPPSVWALEQYYGELNARFDTGFNVKLSADPQVDSMIPPRGSFLLALPSPQSTLPHNPNWTGSGPGPLGCVALKGSGGPVAEIKRLWVSPSARKLGLGRALMQAVEGKAKEVGIKVLRLDSNTKLPEAIAFYKSLGGWNDIPRFNQDPYPDVFLEKVIA